VIESIAMKRVTIDILGHQFSVKTDGDEEYIRTIAAYVNSKSRAVMEATQTVSTVDLVIKVAMNLADELLQERAAAETLHRTLSEQAKLLIRDIEVQLEESPANP
jgi:cell division protein ZapA (FtsZ GTPase activity inhibitor)